MTPAGPILWRGMLRQLAQGFGVGRLPGAPGTFGTLAAVPLYLALAGLSPTIYAAVVVLLFGLGVWAAETAGRDLGAHDHPSIVWDEIVGFLITMFLAPAGWLWVVTGFLLFRLFDIWKPWPLNEVDRRLTNGFGCMLDDALAGLCAWVVLQAAAFIVASQPT